MTKPTIKEVKESDLFIHQVNGVNTGNLGSFDSPELGLFFSPILYYSSGALLRRQILYINQMPVAFTTENKIKRKSKIAVVTCFI